MTSTNKTVVFLASDLMLSSTVSGFAAANDLRFRSVGSAAELSNSEPNGENILLLIDLGLAGLDVSILSEVVSAQVLATAVAYGPHVHTAKLQAAQQAGVGNVMSRGQFCAQAGKLISTFAARGV
jgi:hypothetical protein